MSRSAKIIATIGPSSGGRDGIRELAKAGVNVVRFNCAHGDWAERRERMADVRAAETAVGRPIAILLDLAGPKVRLGKVAGGTRRLSVGDDVRIELRDPSPDGLHLPIAEFFAVCRPSSKILIGDGYVSLKVSEVTADRITARVLTGGEVSNHQGVTLAGQSVPLDAITEKDDADLRTGLAEGIDYVALSYVRSFHDIERLRSLIEGHGADVPIIAKIETREAVREINVVISAADAVMVARGDLGLQVDFEEVPWLQKRIIAECNQVGKPVITATQMLESMIVNSRPTRAEAADVFNAILDGSDAVMLSGETAKGAHPVAAVEAMARIAVEAEAAMRTERTAAGRTPSASANPTMSVAGAACRLAAELGARAIISATTSGHTARMVARFRPRAGLLAATPNERVYRRLAMVWGVEPLLLNRANNTDEMIDAAIRAGKESRAVKPNDMVIVTAGIPIGVSGNTNLIFVRRV